MTEAEWFACNEPGSLLPLSWEETTRRKILLFGSACCRRIWELLIHPATRTVVEVVERYADGSVEQAQLDDAAEGARIASNLAHKVAEPFASAPDPEPASYETAAHAAYKLVNHGRPLGWRLMQQAAEAASEASGRAWEPAEQVALIRDIFGNPFRPISIHPSWFTPTVLSLARSAYHERFLPSGELDRGRLAVLSDALEEAGCDDASILGHLRSPGPHVRGCHVLDLILGRA